MKHRIAVAFFLVVLLALTCSEALASGGISDFDSPMEKVVNTVTGPWGKYVSIIGMALVGVVYIFRKDDISGVVAMLLNIVFAICFIAFATNIVTTVFGSGFSGAVL